MTDSRGGQTQGDGSELIHRFRAGDEDAFQELFERYGPSLSFRIAQKLPQRLRRKIAVSDVVQESFLAAFDARSSLREETEHALRAWLLAIAQNKVHETVRHLERTAKRDARREVTQARRSRTAQFPGALDSPSQVAIGVEMHALAQHAMRRLPPDYQEILRLARQEHLTLVQAADRMGRSHEATKKLYGRAMARFRIEFQKFGGDAP